MPGTLFCIDSSLGVIEASAEGLRVRGFRVHKQTLTCETDRLIASHVTKLLSTGTRAGTANRTVEEMASIACKAEVVSVVGNTRFNVAVASDGTVYLQGFLSSPSTSDDQSSGQGQAVSSQAWRRLSVPCDEVITRAVLACNLPCVFLLSAQGNLFGVGSFPHRDGHTIYFGTDPSRLLIARRLFTPPSGTRVSVTMPPALPPVM